MELRSLRLALVTGLVSTGLALAACGGASGGGGSSSGASTQSPPLALFAGSIVAPGGAATFNMPEGVATDGAGNVYVADFGNNTIRMITSAGVVTTLAGTAGTTGSADGTGAAASFNGPLGVVTDGASNVYVSDSDNGAVRKITPGGVVTTLALSGALTSFSPMGWITIDSAGNLYVGSNGSIYKTTPAGVVSGPDNVGLRAAGLATDTAGNIYSASIIGNQIRENAVIIAGAGASGSTDSSDGSAATFNEPDGLARDSAGNLYVADLGNSTIRKISSPTWAVTTLAGTALMTGTADGAGTTARFNSPTGVAVDGASNLYVADSQNNTIREITPAGVVTTLTLTAGSTGSNADGSGAAAGFNAPEGIAADGSGNVYVADSGNNTIRKITPDGLVSTPFAASFSVPVGVAMDGTGNVYVADTAHDTIQKITPAGVVTVLAGTDGSPGSADGTEAAALFNSPHGIAVDGAGNVYVADTFNSTIRKIAAGGVTTLAGSAGNPGSADNTGTAALFNEPFGVATDSAGNVVVADTLNDTIRMITSGGVVTTLAGTAGTTGSADGTGAAASFNHPQGVATDGAGNVYVADTLNSTIRKITPAGVVTTVVGVAGQEGFLQGELPGEIFRPLGVAVHGNTLYVTMYHGVVAVSPLP